MRRILFLSLMAVLLSISAIAGVNQKLSGSTQLFIAERDGRISLDIEKDVAAFPTRTPLLSTKQVDRVIARPEVVDGVEMVPAFIHVDPNATAQIESLGVVIQERFKSFVVALIPVDKIESVAEIAAVRQVNVACEMNVHTDMSRFYTNTLQVIDHSNAIAAGLPDAFKGDGIVVGVIDTGIDFQHAMFKDANGNTRIKQAYVMDYDTGTFTSYTGEAISTLTTDYSGQSHGTHTATTAAGSNLTYNGITYGGVAPEADLVLVGLGEHLYTTDIAMGIKYIFDYADSQNMPAVCSISLGTQFGPHDGTGEFAEIYEEYGGDNPNHILVISAGNDASYSPSYGFSYVEGETSAAAPFATVINSLYNVRTTQDINRCYMGYESFYARTPDVPLACKLHVVNTSTHKILWTSDEVTEYTIDDFSGISEYFTGFPEVYIYQDDYNGKYNVIVYTNGMMKTTAYRSPKFAFAVSVYPIDGDTCMIDGWEAHGDNRFANYNHIINGYMFTAGSDDCTLGDRLSTDDVISVGAYVSKNRFNDVDGIMHSADHYTVNDIAYFSSYQTPGHGPTGEAKPDICAPGAIVVAGVNSYDTEGYMSDDYRDCLVCDDMSQPLGCMEGTSMSAPCVAGIIALYLQAAQSIGKTLNTNDIRDIFANTAIHDEYTTQSNFGKYGKIDALAGIEYILASQDTVITVDVDSIYFNPTYTGYESSRTIRIKGSNLTSNVQLSFSHDNTHSFGLSKYTITPEQAAAGASVTVFFSPTGGGGKHATLNIMSDGAETVSIPVKGCGIKSDGYITAWPASLNFEAEPGTSVTKTFNVTYSYPNGSIMISSVGRDEETMPNDDGAGAGAVLMRSGVKDELSRVKTTFTLDSMDFIDRRPKDFGPITPVVLKGLVLELTGDDCFDVSPARINILSVPCRATVTVTYHPDCVGDHAATLTIKLTGGSANPVVMPLHGSATAQLNAPSIDVELINSQEVTSLSGTADVSDLAMYSKVFAKGQSIIIESPIEQTAIISDIAGHATTVNLQAGYNEFPVNSSGIYIVRIRENTAKLMLK